jgi:sugar phosphate isomerase/epimerase
MLIGAMNHPGRNIAEEIGWIASMRLDFIDLTLEPPMASSQQVQPAQVRELLQQKKLGIVGHTAYYLPFASPFEELRQTAVREAMRCLEVFSAAGAKWMNIHPDTNAPLHGKSFLFDRNMKSIEELLAAGKSLGVGIMAENIPGTKFNSKEDLGILLDALPELGLHLDLGHCNLSPIANNAETILETYGDRLRHVHLHDNKGGDQDLHLPLGVGIIDVPRLLRALKGCGYDNTITLEVFSPDKHYLEYSRNVLLNLWEKA